MSAARLMTAPAPLAVTMGEPGGIGGEIAVAAWRALRDTGPCFFALDDPARLDALGADILEIDSPEQAPGAFSRALPVLALAAPVLAASGVVDARNAPAVVESIRRAVLFALNGEAAGIVTNPIHKRVLRDAGFPFPGHTEFLGELTAATALPAGLSLRGPVMMLAGPDLKTTPVTVHLPLVEAAKTLQTETIFRTGAIVGEALKADFGVAAPRLAIAGLNPHAGEGGMLGEEDLSIVAPAVEQLRKAGFRARGPLPADSMFHAEARTGYDAAICMYHDQALIPVKTLAFHETVNVTLGLPVVRVSPDHGAALDIAGNGQARPDSLIAAIRLAAAIASRRSRL